MVWGGGRGPGGSGEPVRSLGQRWCWLGLRHATEMRSSSRYCVEERRKLEGVDKLCQEFLCPALVIHLWVPLFIKQKSAVKGVKVESFFFHVSLRTCGAFHLLLNIVLNKETLKI